MNSAKAKKIFAISFAAFALFMMDLLAIATGQKPRR